MPRIGELNTRLKVQSQTTVQSTDSGEVTASWTTDAIVWAGRDMTSRGGREFLESDQPRQERRAVWTIRHRSDVTSRHRLVEAASTGTVWDVVSAFDPDGKRQWTKLQAVLRDA